MSSKSFVLAYSIENQNSALKLEEDLGKAGIRFTHLVCDPQKEGSLAKKILKTEGIVFLLISDNFLKSSSCMHEALKMLNTCLSHNRIQSIKIDGEFYNKATSSFEYYPTEFSKIGDLIKYMNHWQEQYLSMRKNKANINEHEEQAYSKELKRVRTISSEIGEFLKILRETHFWSISDLEESYYEQFFSLIGKKELLNKYKEFQLGEQDHPANQVISSSDEIINLPEQKKDHGKSQEEESKEMTEIELKNKKTYDIIADIFDDSETDEEIQNKETIAEINEIENTAQKEDAVSEQQDLSMDNKDAFFNRISYLLDDNEDHLALKQLELFVQQNPNESEAYLWMSRIAQNEENYQLAKDLLETTIELDKNDAVAQTEYGQLLFHYFKNDHKAAAKAFKKAINHDDSIVDAYYYYALLMTEVQKKPEKAIKYFKKTIALDATHPFANYDLAFLYYNQQDKLSAAKYYESAFTINPELRVPENDKAFGYDVYLKEKKRLKKNKKRKKKEKHKKENFESDIEPIDTPVIKIEPTQDQIPAQEKKTVLITGATSGIGKATAELFAQNDYRVIITGRRQDRLEEMKKNFEENYKTDVYTMEFDVRDWHDSKERISALPEKWQSIDLLINNAGLAKGYAPVHEGELKHWETMIDTNIKGLLYMTRLVTPGMIERNHGQIINVCSSAGHEVYPNGAVYCATKHAVDALTTGLRLELFDKGIRVSQVSPGHVEETEFAAVRFDGDLERAAIYNDFQPLKSSDVAEAIYFMASRPQHVTVQDIILMGTQQASNIFIDRSGRK